VRKYDALRKVELKSSLHMRHTITYILIYKLVIKRSDTDLGSTQSALRGVERATV